MTPALRQRLPLAGATVLYPLLALWQARQAFFSPVAVILGGADQPDWTGTLWTWWWTWTALLSGRNPAVAADNLYPVGLDPVAQYNLLDGVLLGWLIPAIGPTRGYNLAGLLLLAGAGWTGFWMCRRLDVPGWAALIAGMMLQTSAMVLVEVTGGRLSQALVFFAGMAFVSLLQLSCTDRPKGAAVAGGVYTALAALTYWYAALFVAVGALPTVLREWRRFPRVALAASTCLVVCAPALVALVGFGSDLPGLDRAPGAWMADSTWTGGSYGLGMAMGSAHQPFWPVWAAAGDAMDKRLSLLLLALASVGAVKGPRVWRRPLMGAAVAGWLLTLGPWLKLPSGDHLPVPLPWLGLHHLLPYFDRLWWPERFELTVMLALVPLAGLGLAHLGTRWGAGRVGAVAVVVWAAELALLSPYSPIPASPPRAFDGTLYAAVDGPILTTPVLAPDPDIRHALWLQVLHEQPVTAGLGEHLPGHVSTRWTDHIAANGLLSVLEESNRAATTHRSVSPADVEALIDAGLTWAVVDSAVLPRARSRIWLQRESTILRAVWGPPDVETRGGAAWRIRPIQEAKRIPDLGPPPSTPEQGAFTLQR